MNLHKTPRFNLLALSILAALLYSAWPLGYLLNPGVSKSSLASGLEAYGQPYNWVFISTDIASAVILIIVVCLLWLSFKNQHSETFLLVTLCPVIIFCLGTIVDAMLPERCIPNYNVCPSFTHDNLLLIHGIFDIAASMSLFICLCAIWLKQRLSLLINGLVLGYMIFGLISLAQLFLPGQNGNWSQHYYLTLCSIWIAFLPYAISHTFSSRLPNIRLINKVRAEYFNRENI